MKQFDFEKLSNYNRQSLIESDLPLRCKKGSGNLCPDHATLSHLILRQKKKY